MARQAIPSLDVQGTQAAVYPSEQQLWVQGAPINDPYDQGVVFNAEGVGKGGGGAYPPVPVSEAHVQQTEDWIFATLNGETPNTAYWEDVVNPAVYGPQGFGDWNVQPGQSGHSQNIVSDPSSEQGWGVGPARRNAHYPKVESPNPARNEGQHLRNGELAWVVADSSLYERSQLAWEQQWDKYKRRSPTAPVVPVPDSVPFSATVPSFSGGPSPYPGVDMPVGDEAAIYG